MSTRTRTATAKQTAAPKPVVVEPTPVVIVPPTPAVVEPAVPKKSALKAPKKVATVVVPEPVPEPAPVVVVPTPVVVVPEPVVVTPPTVTVTVTDTVIETAPTAEPKPKKEKKPQLPVDEKLRRLNLFIETLKITSANAELVASVSDSARQGAIKLLLRNVLEVYVHSDENSAALSQLIANFEAEPQVEKEVKNEDGTIATEMVSPHQSGTLTLFARVTEMLKKAAEKSVKETEKAAKKAEEKAVKDAERAEKKAAQKVIKDAEKAAKKAAEKAAKEAAKEAAENAKTNASV